MFTLSGTLKSDTRHIVTWDLCQVLLMNDRQYPWLILVPQREGLRDLYQLADADKPTMTAEIDRATKALVGLHKPDKMNVASLGNVVPQLHVHVIARFKADAAWPRPVWGVKPVQPYTDAELAETMAALKKELA